MLSLPSCLEPLSKHTLDIYSLYGVTCLQTWYYFRNYEDRWLLRVTVLAILVLETIHAILAMHVVYHFLILNFDHPLALLRDIW
ncbi:hypothetical protein Moror_2301 [Moniliophthora roreri MCA 2997]|uniref:Uncharacterized protein n=1 Tax=Moniliophthora roreri (strain MCA 2997) TaxID=1381753 RepID=V2X0E1_MONRO|nr:hypothetical protein Moror_2301 [Moniliophthora roreri MCA 2997]